MAVTTKPGAPSEIEALVIKLMDETVNHEVWKQIKFWGQTTEDDMLMQAQNEWEYSYYDITMVAIPGSVQRIGVTDWIVGYQFTIAHQYFDTHGVECGKLSKFVFLAFNEDGKIAEIYYPEQISDFAPTDKPN